MTHSISAPAYHEAGFTPVSPFGETNKLKPAVASDHAEIAIQTPDQRVINAWNISNPKHHDKFRFGDNPPFKGSHLFVKPPYTDGVMEASLRKKIDLQVETIADRFVSGDVSVQVIVEGYKGFYDELATALLARGHDNFRVVSLLDNPPEGLKATKNVTGILINTDHYDVLSSDVKTVTYSEAANDGAESELVLPWAHLADKASGRETVVAGVHLKGNAAQYPKTGLQVLAKEMHSLWLNHMRLDGPAGELSTTDVIALGDYNTPPATAVDVAKALVDDTAAYSYSKANLYTAPYTTHVNPSNDAASYDVATVLTDSGSPGEYKMLDSSAISAQSRALIESIEQARLHLVANTL